MSKIKKSFSQTTDDYDLGLICEHCGVDSAKLYDVYSFLYCNECKHTLECEKYLQQLSGIGNHKDVAHTTITPLSDKGLKHYSVLEVLSKNGLRSLFENIAKNLDILPGGEEIKPSSTFQLNRFPYWSALQDTIQKESDIELDLEDLKWFTRAALEALVAERILYLAKERANWNTDKFEKDPIEPFYRFLSEKFKPLDGYLEDAGNALELHFANIGKPILRSPTTSAKSLLLTLKNSKETNSELAEFESFLSGKKSINFDNIQNLDNLSGTEFESLLKELFISEGYAVEQIGGTGDQGADLILKGNNQKIVIQAKRYTDSVGNSAVQEAISAREYYQCEKAIVITTSRFTSSAKDLAYNTGVDLWDRVTLDKKLLNKKIG